MYRLVRLCYFWPILFCKVWFALRQDKIGQKWLFIKLCHWFLKVPLFLWIVVVERFPIYMDLQYWAHLNCARAWLQFICFTNPDLCLSQGWPSGKSPPPEQIECSFTRRGRQSINIANGQFIRKMFQDSYYRLVKILILEKIVRNAPRNRPPWFAILVFR